MLSDISLVLGGSDRKAAPRRSEGDKSGPEKKVVQSAFDSEGLLCDVVAGRVS